MTELYNRVCNMQLGKEISNHEDVAFLYGAPVWNTENEHLKQSRGKVCKEKFQPCNWVEIEYQRKGISQERTIMDGFKVKFNSSLEENYVSLDIDSMSLFLDTINTKFKSLIVDITLINIRFLGAFLAVLPYYDWDSIYFCYTEPGEYIEKDDKGVRSFDLKYSTLGFDEIPNLQTEGDNTTECEWIVFMGFEGARLRQLDEEASPGRKYVIPVMCIPSMRAEWRNYAIEVNMEFIENLKELEQLKYVSAVNPFEVYEFLTNEKQNTGLRMKISPVGTKLTVLGSIMYIIENSEDMLLTDNPYQEDENAINFGSTYCYDLSYYIKTVKNKRFNR